QPSMLYVDEKPADTLFIHVYPSDKPSMFTLYEDDGETRDYEKGIYLLTPFTFTKEGDRLVLQVGDREGAYKPSPRSFMIIIHLVEKKPTRVSLNDAALTQATSPEEMLKAEQGWIFDDAKKLLQVKIRDNGKRQQLTINLS
ncbi:MAG: DUF5110 domain-containing protein, partial [Nitrososphaerota archaeon]